MRILCLKCGLWFNKNPLWLLTRLFSELYCDDCMAGRNVIRFVIGKDYRWRPDRILPSPFQDELDASYAKDGFEDPTDIDILAYRLWEKCGCTVFIEWQDEETGKGGFTQAYPSVEAEQGCKDLAGC